VKSVIVKGWQFLLIIRRDLCDREGSVVPAYYKT
jgi:hypothetical protein